MPSQIALKLFGEYLRKNRDKYLDVQKTLRQARLPISVEAYMADAYFYSIIAGFMGLVVGGFLAFLIVYVIGLPPTITKVPAYYFGPLLAYRDIIVAVLITASFTLLFWALTFFLMRASAGMKVGDRRKKIDLALPHAITYMYALSRGGVNILEVFRSLSKAEDAYGEVAKEIRVIVNDMDLLGYDLREAIKHLIETTPSEKMKDLMHSLLTVIDTGGDIVAFFREKADVYLEKAVAEQKGFLETLGLLAESYVTALVAGPLFLIIIQSAISMMAGGGEMAVMAIVYIFIPVGSIMFVFLIRIITPGEAKAASMIELEAKPGERIEIPEGERKKYEELVKASKSYDLRRMLRNPLAPLYEDPFKALYFIGMPLGLLLIIFGIMSHLSRLPEVIDTIIIFSGIVMMAPFVYFYEAKERRHNRVRNEIPDFLHRLAITNEIGMTIPQSIEIIAKEKHGSLTEEVRRVWRDIRWGISVHDAFARFANRLRIPSVSRTVKLLTHALKSTGDVKEVLDITAKDAKTAQLLERDRRMNMFIYVVIIYMSFFVFCAVILILSTSFIPVMARSTSAAAAAGAGQFGGGISLAHEIPVELYRRMFFHAAVLQGFGGGLMAGQMGEGKALSGLKHSMIMIVMAIVFFSFI